MATSFVYNRVNVNGIPCIESKSITESTTSVTFNFSASPAVSTRFSGLIAVRIAEQAASSADTLPVYFNVPSIAGTTIALTTFGGTAVTGVELQEGIHLVFYDRENGVLQLLI
jgi:hypothetical protein